MVPTAGLNYRAADAQLTLARLCKLHPGIRCNEGRESWVAAQQQFPQLQAIPYPATLPELAP